MIARGLVRAVAASIFLHGAAAAVTVAWDRSRPDDADAAEGLSVIVDVVWLAAPEAAAASLKLSRDHRDWWVAAAPLLAVAAPGLTD